MTTLRVSCDELLLLTVGSDRQTNHSVTMRASDLQRHEISHFHQLTWACVGVAGVPLRGRRRVAEECERSRRLGAASQRCQLRVIHFCSLSYFLAKWD